MTELTRKQAKPVKITKELRAVKLRYGSGGRNLSKKLFGYGPWTERKAGKTYEHIAVTGVLNGILAQKCGKSCLIVPQSKRRTVEKAIIDLGGEVKSIVPLVMTTEELKQMTDNSYLNHLRILKELLKDASTAEDKKTFKDSLKRAAILTKKFTSYIEEASEYAEEKTATEALDQLFSGLQAISKQDFEAGKIQAEFIEKSIAREYNNLLKASDK